MRAAIYRRYGTPDVLELGEVERPVPGDEDVLVRVHAAAVTMGDHHMVTGKPYLIRLSPYGGLPGPRNKVPGGALAGRVHAVGAKVTGFRVGDEVLGQAMAGAFAEYTVVPAAALALKPGNLSMEEAATVPWAATALQGLRDVGQVTAGQRVLINGASGGVGTWAVQLARALGAEVTAVCSARNAELVKSLGAAEVIDYAKEDFTRGGARFDVMLDLVGNRSLPDCLRALSPKGVYVACAGGGGDWLGPLPRLAGMALRSLFSSQRLKTFVSAPKQADLRFLKELVEAGKARPVIERSWALSDIAEALRHVGEGHSRGQSVVRVAG
ncbi:MAG TPA: NAD(P)-dependent alcohol dehydrogenase [Myxococcus sp.]|nr:NAD(P)-dependent alcohol dehydrogenase [Myxococcus sp.]